MSNSLSSFKNVRFGRHDPVVMERIHKMRSSNHRQRQKSFDRDQDQIYKYIRPKSKSSIRLNDKVSVSTKFIKNTKKVYQKLSQQLSSIQQSISQLKARRKKTKAKVPNRVVTEAVQALPKQSNQNFYKDTYKDTLKHIQTIKKANNRAAYVVEIKPRKQERTLYLQPVKVIQVQQKKSQKSDSVQQKTLFYGVQYIDKIMFKIKIKINKKIYSLFGKNNHTKIMLQMPYQQYMKFHKNQLKGNPCNIFKYLTIQNNKVKLLLRGDKNKLRARSFKSYLGYY